MRRHSTPASPFRAARFLLPSAPMDRPLHSVRTRLDDFLAELATLHYRHGAGLATGLPVSSLYASFPELSSPDTYAAANEALAKARLREEPLTVRRIQLVRELVASQVEEALAARASEAVATLEAQSQLPVDDQTLSLAEALGELPRESARGRRTLLERAVGTFLWDHRGPYGDRREAMLHTVERLGVKDYPTLRQEVTGIDFGKLAEAAAETLRRTEDAYRDVLGYVLKKVDPTLRPFPGGEARRHDLQAALQAPWMDALFRREDAFPAVVRWLGEWHLTPNAEGRIRIDDEARPGKAPRPFVAAVRVPEEVRLVIQPRGGLDSLGSLLHEMGHAQHRAHVSEKLPMELRRLGDASVTEAYAALFERLLLSPNWLKRYLDLPTLAARDAVRGPGRRPLREAVLRAVPQPSRPLGGARGRVRGGPAAGALRRAAPGLLPPRRGPAALHGPLPARVGAGDAALRVPHGALQRGLLEEPHRRRLVEGAVRARGK